MLLRVEVELEYETKGGGLTIFGSDYWFGYGTMESFG
jgi:hypothetical protein